MLNKGQWIRITAMRDEPRYSGKVGQVDFVDSIGQIHGTWGGCALIPGVDDYELLTDEQAREHFAAIDAQRAAYEPPFAKGAKPVSVPFTCVPVLSRCEWKDGRKPTQEVECCVDLDLNGRYAAAKECGQRRATIVGVPDNMVGAVDSRIRHVLRTEFGMDCCPTCLVKPCDMRKSESAYMPAIEKAVRLAIGVEEDT